MIKLTKKEQVNLEAWKNRESWSRETTLNKEFGYGNDYMPWNLVAPNVKGGWQGGRNANFVCVMCEYVTTATNIHRRCPEMPATAELTRPEYCYSHNTIHEIEKDGKKVPTCHETIGMVRVR